MNKTEYYVVRISKMDDVDPIAEINAVIEKSDSCWFGKYGQPMGKRFASEVNDGIENVVLIVVYNDLVEKTGYIYEVYKCKEVSGVKPKSKNYPKYYEKFMGRISTWMRLEKYKKDNILLENLYVRSSAQSIFFSLNKSMRGVFRCYLR